MWPPVKQFVDDAETKRDIPNRVTSYEGAMKQAGNQLKGLSITGAGVLILSPDGALTNLITLDDWSLIFWRGILLAAALLAITFIMHRGSAKRVILAMGWHGIGVGLLFAIGTIFFVLSVRLTSIANALVLLAIAPIFGALFSRLFLGEEIPKRTYITTLLAIIGTAIIFGGDLGTGNIWGNGAALIVSACGGGFFVILRAAQMPEPAPAFALGGIIASAVGLAFAPDGLAVESPDIVPLALLGLVVLPVSFAMVGRGPRYLPAPEVNLIMLAEAILGTLWAVALLGQMPAPATYLGGAILLAALGVHFAIGLRQEKRATPH